MRRAFILALLVVFSPVGMVGAQTQTGTVQGKVTDQQGAVLPGVTVTLTGTTRLADAGHRRAGRVPLRRRGAGHLRGEGGALGLPAEGAAGHRRRASARPLDVPLAMKVGGVSRDRGSHRHGVDG